MPDASVKESRERVRSALRNSGLEFPVGRYTVNLAPADTRKEGPAFELPIAIAIMICAGALEQSSINGMAISGELALGGGVNPINGALSMAITARQLGFKRIMLPSENAPEASCIQGLDVIPVSSLADVEAPPHRPAKSLSRCIRSPIPT